jgi:hypothetical protein
MTDVAPGTIALKVTGPSFDPEVVEGVEVRPDAVAEVGTIVVRKGRAVSGRVLTAGGEPVEGATVFVGSRLVGDGEKLTLDTWGPGYFAKETTTGPDGGFRIAGIGFKDVALTADHPEHGRSPTVRVPGALEGAVVDLVLAPLGSIEGVVVRGGEPVEDVAVNASPKSLAQGSNFVVRSGADGTFRFDRLAPDDYVVSALRGSSPLAGVSFDAGRVVAVTAGQTATVRLELAATAATLVVTPRLPDGSVPQMAEVHSVSGALAATTAAEVRAHVSALGAGTSTFNIILGGRPAKLRNLAAGDYTVCVIAYPDAVAGRDAEAVLQWVDEHSDALPAACKPVKVTAAPEQAVTIDVPVPVAEGEG